MTPEQLDHFRALVIDDAKDFFRRYDGIPELAAEGSPVRILHDFCRAYDEGAYDETPAEMAARIARLEAEVDDLQDQADDVRDLERALEGTRAQIDGARESLEDALARLHAIHPDDLADTLRVLINLLARST